MALEPVAPPAATVRLLGGVSLLVDGEPRLARRLKTVALLGCLARSPGGRCRRAWLADLLWGDAGDERARHSLRQALADLRRHLGPAIRSTPEEAWLERDGIEIDLDAFERAIAAGAWNAAVAAWGGDFLAGADASGTAAFAEWLARERAALGDRLATACAHLVADARDAGDADAALAHAERWTTLLPGDERGHRAVIELLAQTGRTGEAAIAHAAAMTALEPGTGASSEFLRLAGSLVAISRAARRVPAPRAPEIAGRSAASDVLDAAWTRVREGAGAVIAIEAEEGLGKSHALRCIEARLSTPASTARVLVARALTGERREPGALLRRLAGVEPHVDAAAALTQLLATATAAQPLALLVDDAGLADEASQGWLGEVARRAPAHVLLVLAMRPLALNDVRFRPALRQNPAVRALQLGPLTVEETEALVRERYAVTDAESLLLAERLRRDARGIPAVVEAILALLEEEGYLVSAGEGWRLARELPLGGLCLPADARERARRQLPRLTAAARALVEVAATAGEVVDERLVLRVASLAEPAQALAELERRRLLAAAGRVPGALEFSAPGVRQAVLDQLTPQRREALRKAVDHGQRQLRDAGHRGHLPRALGDSRPRFALLRATLGLAGRISGVAALVRGTTP